MSLSDNLPYTFLEQRGKETVDISDEIPFEIPESWEWLRFCNLVNYSMGKTPPRKEADYWNNPVYNWVSIADMVSDGHISETKEKVNEYAANYSFKNNISLAGTLLMSFKLTVGKVSILDIDAFHNEAIISIYPYVDTDKITRDYLFCVLPLLSQLGDTKTAIKGNTLNSTSLDNLLIPLPSLNEQRRIVEKLFELYPIVNDYGKIQSIADDLNESFSDSLKKSILQEAVQGKLVSQDPADEPASVLLERIRAEKEQLIKAGKIKRDKHESVIFRRDNSHYEKLDGIERCIDDEIPFEIPDSWVWTRLGQVISLLSGTDFKPEEYNDVHKGTPYITGASSLSENGVLLNRWTETPKVIANFGDVLLVCKGSGYGKTVICDIEEAHIARQIMAIKKFITLDMHYLRLFLQANLDQIKSKGQGVIPGIDRNSVMNLLFPVPPLTEQCRIVEKQRELFDKITLI